MKLRLSADLVSGLIFLTLGVLSLIHSSQYPLGTASRMGAAYFPRLISIGLVVIGAALFVRSIRGSSDRLTFDGLRPLFFVLLGTLSFGLLIENGGLLLAGFILVVLSRFALPDYRAFEVIILAVILVVSAAGLFNYVLGLPIPVLPRW